MSLSFAEWSDKKKKEEEEKNLSGTSSVPTKSSTTGSKMSFAEWSDKKMVESPGSSLSDWGNSAYALMTDVQNKASKWHGEKEYKSRREQATKLLGLADSWRKQYAGNEEAISYIDSVVAALEKADSVSFSAYNFFSGFKDEEDYNFWDTHSTVEKRQAWYKEQQDKVSDLGSYYDNYYTIDLLYQDYKANPSAYTPEEAQDIVAKYEKHNTYKQKYGSISDVKAEIEAAETEMRNYEYANVNENGRFYGSKVVDDNYAVTQRPDFAITSAKRDYANPTKEDLLQYDAYNDSSTWYYDANGVYRDVRGNELVEDESGNLVSPLAKDTQVKDKLGAFLSFTEDDIAEAQMLLTTPSGESNSWAQLWNEGNQNSWKYLDDTELGIYYTYLGESQEKAYQYLEDMATELNRRQTLDKMGKWDSAYGEANLLEKIAMNAATIPAKFISTTVGAVESAANMLSGREYNPYSLTNTGMHFSQSVRGNTAEELDKTGFKIPVIDFTLGDIYQTGMSRLDSALATGIFGGGGTVFLGMGAAQEEAYRLYQQGASADQITLGSFAAGAAEAVWEYVSYGALKEIDNVDTFSKWIKSILIQGYNEMREEAATEVSNLITNALVMGSQSDLAELYQENEEKAFWTFVDILKQTAHAAFGGFIGGMGAGTSQATGSYANALSQYSQAGNTIRTADGGAKALENLAMSVAGATEGKISDNLKKQAGKVSGEVATGKGIGKVGAAIKNFGRDVQAGRLHNDVTTANKIANTSANQADIAKSLQRKGFNAETSNDLAAALVARYNGQPLTKAQSRLLESAKDNTAVQKAISDIISNEQSTVGQRQQNIRDFNAEVNTGIIAKTYGMSKEAVKNLVSRGLKGKSTATAETVYEGGFEVSKEGKASIDGKEVKLDGLQETGDGVMVATADGQTADGGDITFPSKGHALVYEGYLGLEGTALNPVIKGMSVASRSVLARAYDLEPGTNGKVYFEGANQTYWYGFEGMSLDALPENSPIRSLNEEQIKIAYEEGRKAGRKATDTQDRAIKAAHKAAVEKLGGKKAASNAAKKNGGAVILENNIQESAMTKKEKASKDLADRVAQAIGKNIHVYRGMQEYGKYDPATGEIWLNINGNISGSSMMAFALSHELVHMAKQWSPSDFKVFADYLVEQYGKKGYSVEKLVRLQMDNAIDNGYTLDEHEAYEEVIADACQRMLLDSDALQKMAGYRVNNPDKWQRIVDAIRKFINNVRKVFKGADPDSLESALFKEFDDAVKNELEKKFVTMVMNASEHMNTIQNAFGKNTVVEVNANGEFTLAKGEVGGATKFLYNDSTWEKGGRDTLEAALKAEGFSREDIDAALTIMDGKHKLVKELAKKFPEQARINKATITTDLKDGHSVLSALVSNGDYPVNIDLLMVCKKRKAYQRVINRLCETGLIQQATVDALAIAEINKILGKYGFETACLGCFVESRRLRIQEWAETIVKEWNSEVKKRNPNAKAFGFGNGEATLTEDEVMQLVGELEGHEKNDKGNLNLGQGSAVKRMGVLLDKVPSLAKTLAVEDLITPDGLTALRKYDSNLFSMVKSRYGSNSPKFVQEFNPYNHELAMYGKVPTEYESLRDYLYAIGGARMQSFSDFIVENWFDYCQIVADLAARKLPMHTYTKEITLAKLFGLTGIKINMSLIPDIDRSLGKEYAGLTFNKETGEYELIWADKDRFKKTGGKSYMQSINFADAIALQSDPRYSSNVGTIAVGVSDKHILMMLDDARIRMVIPYHSSGMNPIFADLMGTSFYKDYTMFQNTTVKQLYNSKGQKVSLKLDKTQTGKLTSGFQFNEVLQELGDARAAAEAYKEWCADASKHTITIKGETYTAELTPKFNDFSGHKNYYKLLEDFNTYDCISEEAAQQGDVQQVYPDNFDEILKGELKAQETHRQKQETNQAFDNAMGEIETYLKSHTKADTVFYAEQHGVKLSAKDKKLNAADKAKLADLRKGMKMSMPKAKAPTFYSHMARVVDGVKQEKLGASSIVSMLRGKGVKAEEIKWSGIEEWLQGKKSVTKAELQEFVAGSMLQIEEDVLDYKERPYTEDQKKRLAEYEAKRDEVVQRLVVEWKKITGEDLTIRNAAGLESMVTQAILEANSKQKKATFEGRLLAKLKSDLKEVIENNDDFGFYSWMDAMRSIHRHRRDFITHYEMSTNEKAIIVKYCNALNAYNELPNMISDADTDRLRAIAREAAPWNRKIMEVNHEHNEEAAKHMPNWKEYSLKGGKNYREMLFRIPGSTYSNAAMFTHWKEKEGVLAHARLQDMDTFIGRMLFIEEIQSDWHNEGHKEGYRKEGEKTDLMLRRESKKAYEEFYTAVEKMLEVNANWEDDNAIYYAHPVAVAEMFEGNESHFDKFGFTKEQRETIRSMVAEEAARQEALKTAPKHDTAPDAPFKDTYHEYVMKRLLREAAEQGYDSIGWTTSDVQMERWNPQRKTNAELGITDAKNPDAVAFENGYRIEYDQDIPKFLSKYGKKWGTTVGKTVLDNGTEVWSMAITDSMMDSVLYEGQPKYSLPKISMGMTDSERYAILKDAKISVQTDDGSAAYINQINSIAELGDRAKSRAEKIIIPLAKDLGILNKPMSAADIDIDFIFSIGGGLKESLNKQLRYGGNYVDFAKTIINLDKVINSAVLIEKHPDKYKGTSREDRNLEAVFVMVSAFRDGDYVIPVQLEIKKSSNDGGRLYLTVAMTKIEASVLGGTVDENQALHLIPASITYNLADIFRKINPQDGHFLKYLPDGFLSEVQKESKRKAIEEDDVRISSYKLSTYGGMSPRQLLANAFDSLAQKPKERELMAEYQKNIAKVEDVQERLKNLRGKISELTKSNGDKGKIAEMNKTAKDLADLIDKYDRKLLELEASKPLRDVLARAKSAAYQEARERSEKSLKEYRQQVSERFDRGVEGRRKTEMRKKIRRTIRELDKILNRGDKKRNVKEDMKDFVAEALSAADVLFTENYTNEDIVRNGFGVELSAEEAKYLEEARGFMNELSNLPVGGYDAWQARQEAEEKLKSKLAYRMSKLKDAFFRERQRLNKAEVAEVLGNLADAYAKLETSEYAYVNGAYHESVYQYLKMLQEDMGGAKVKDMTLGQLEELHKAYTMVLTTVQNANKMFADDLKQSKEELANRVMMEVYKAGGEHGLWSKGQLARNQASWNNTKPIYAAERTGSSTFVKLVQGLFKGQYKWATDMEEAKAYRQKVADKYGFKSWDMEKTYKFTSSSGIEFELNLNHIMALYAYAKREQAHDHLLKGGFVFGKNTEVVVTKNGIKRTYLNKSAKAHNISDEIMGEIVSKLSEEQKGFVDEMQDYLSTTMGNKGNEISMRLYGVKLFMEKFYFPLRSAGQFKEKAKEAELKQQQGQISIANSGFTHATTPKASNPVVLDGFTDVWASHVNEMSLYHSMVLPMEDFRRVYNYASPNMEGQESASVNSFIENAYGDAATGYFDQLYKELNGGAIVDPRENLSKQMIGKFKKSSVLLSNSVWVQQFSAIGRAYALINPKYFIGAKVDKQKHAALWNEMKQYAPVVIIKEMGGFDTHTGLGAKDYLLTEKYGKGERLKAFIKDEQYREGIVGWAPAMADELTWCAIWEAVKRETNANNPKMDVKSEEFLKKAGERFSEIIEKTQVYDSVLARSANMRSKNGLMQMLTAFMAESTTTVNMVEDALRKGDLKTIAITFGSVAASIILNNALVSIIYGMRDDDEDETFLEKYAQAFTSGMLDDLNPMTYQPILKDIWSLFQGYDIERTDMAIYSDIADAFKKAVTLIANYDSDMDKDDAAEYYKQVGDALMSLLDAGASAFGIPWKNVRRDLMSYYNTVKTFARGGGTTWNSFVDAVGGAALDSLPVIGWIAGESKTDKLYDAITSGDTAYVNRLKGSYKDADAYSTAVRKALRDNDPRVREAAQAQINGNPSERVRIAKLIIADGFAQDDVVRAINSEINALTSSESTSAKKEKGYYTAEDFAKEIANGDQAAANAAKVDIIQTAQKNGKTEDEAKDSFASSARGELKELFLAGEISEDKVIDALVSFCDMDESEAELKVESYAWEAQGYEDVTSAAVRDYNTFCASANVPKDVYLYIRAFSNDTENDKGADGKSIAYSAMKKVMAEINAQAGLTATQKTAIAKSLGWSEKNIQKYKTW